MFETKTPQKDIRLRFAGCLVIVMLSIDDLNPVKVICSILNWNHVYVAWIAFITSIVIFYANWKDLAYYLTKVFLTSIMSIFFSSIEVLGKQNIPAHGPIIFTGNHMNQFVDAAIMLITCPHRVCFLIAEKSYHSRVVGDLAKAVDAIPVSRPQDAAKKGPGLICMDGYRLLGQEGSGTLFKSLQKGDKIRPGRSPDAYRIKTVISDSEALLADDPGEASPLHETVCQGIDKWVEYDILGYIDQGKVFSKVHEALGANGKCLGIFPEGGSHDNTDLLPLKVGISAITFGVLDKYNMTVPIIPVGLNYFRGHRFRGRVVVEFGEPIHLSKELLQVYKQSKRAGYQQLLSEVEDGMRSVIVTAPTYEELKLIHTVRRLYQRSSNESSTKVKQDLARRLSVGFRIIKDKYKSDGVELPADMKEVQQKLEDYQEELDNWGLKDYQINTSLDMPFSKLLYIFMHGAAVLILASIPSIVLNAPVGLAAKMWASKQAQKDLKASRVKVAARDVLLSKKITFSLVAVPVLWLTYAMLLTSFSGWEFRTVVVFLLCFPFFSYVGVMAVEAGMIDLKDLRPAFLRLLPGFRKHAKKLQQTRLTLQREVRSIIKKYGPEMGPLYYEKSFNWEQSMKKSGLTLPSAASEVPSVDNSGKDVHALVQPSIIEEHISKKEK